MGRLDRPLVRNAIYFAIWTAFGGFFFTQELARKFFWDDPTPWWRYLVSWLLGVWLLAALTPAMLALGRRWPIERRGWPARVALHAAFSVGFAAAHVVVVSALAPRIGFLGALDSESFRQTLPILLVVSLHNNVVSYWLVLGAQHGLRYYRRFQEREKQALRLEIQTAELETQLVRARLGALKMQLQPHFLFNTMNAIMVLVRQQRGPEAEETIARLCDLLRFVLDDALAQEVALRKELEYLGLYLSIEQLRFADRLHVAIDVDPAALDAAVPHMALQPIVENAVRHGIAQVEAGGTITLTARRVADRVVIEVADDGPGLGPSGLPRRNGIGLDNTRARLRQLYGARAELTIANAAPSGAVVRLALPYRAMTDDEPQVATSADGSARARPAAAEGLPAPEPTAPVTASAPARASATRAAELIASASAAIPAPIADTAGGAGEPRRAPASELP